MKPTYTVRAERAGRTWILTVPEVPGAVSQVRRLSDAAEYIREVVAFVADVAPDSFDLSVVPTLPRDLEAGVRRARKRLRELEEQQREAAADSRAIVAQLKAEGLTQNDIADVMGLSPQRVSQLAASHAEVKGALG